MSGQFLVDNTQGADPIEIEMADLYFGAEQIAQKEQWYNTIWPTYYKNMKANPLGMKEPTMEQLHPCAGTEYDIPIEEDSQTPVMTTTLDPDFKTGIEKESSF